MHIQPVYVCPYCENELRATLDVSGDMPVGMLPYCDCPESRAAFERQHHAEIEARKNANRGSKVRSRNLLHVGRTGEPVNSRRRSR